jgi:nicotinamide mononucleotide transporter
MDELTTVALSAIATTPPWEGVAVAFAIAYLILATREIVLCWHCALLSTAIYTVLFWDVGLLMDSALNVFYMGMAVYGWQQWRFGGANHNGVAIQKLSRADHLKIFLSIGLLTTISGSLLSQNTDAAWPFVDSFTTWASVITTVMVARKVLENWLYWLVIDAVSIPLYIDRELYLTAVLFTTYLVIAVIGYVSWRRRYASQSTEPSIANR